MKHMLLMTYILIYFHKSIQQLQTINCGDIQWSDIWTNYKSTQQCLQTKSNTTAPTEPPKEADLLNVTNIFIQQGYDLIGVPQDLDGFRLMLLHESLLKYRYGSLNVDDGDDQYTGIYMAKYNKTKTVILKTFKLSNILNIEVTAILTRYLQDTVPTPKVLGLTRLNKKLAIVQEYFPKSKTLDVFLETNNFTEAQLISIASQVTRAVLGVHEKFVLFNDLHPKNVLVNWTNKKPKIKLTDFNQASFKFGEFYFQNSSTERFAYLAPELQNNTLTRPATDVYSLGYILHLVNQRLQKHVLMLIFSMCMHENAQQRPSVKDVHFLLSIFLNNLKTSASVAKVPKRKPALQYIFETKAMQGPIPLIPQDLLLSYSSGERNELIFLRHNEYSKIYVAELHSKMVVVKSIAGDFEFLRQEAMVHLIMNNTGATPLFYGLYQDGQKIKSMSMVSELFGKSVGLDTIVPYLSKQSLEFQASLVVKICDAVNKFHEKGFLINNIDVENILVEDSKTVADVRFVGLNCVSGLNGVLHEVILEELLSFQNTCPELKTSSRTSVAMDVFSLGRVLLQLQLNNAFKLQISVLFKECFSKGSASCPSVDTIKSKFQNVVSILKENNTHQ